MQDIDTLPKLPHGWNWCKELVVCPQCGNITMSMKHLSISIFGLHWDTVSIVDGFIQVHSSWYEDNSDLEDWGLVIDQKVGAIPCVNGAEHGLFTWHWKEQ